LEPTINVESLWRPQLCLPMLDLGGSERQWKTLKLIVVL
jgi:hypothetical protein